jgi:outer membrane protein TolC
MNVLLNRPVENPIGNTEDIKYLQYAFDLNKLKELANENRPLLKAWQAMVNQSDRRLRLARKEYLPDFSLGVA